MTGPCTRRSVLALLGGAVTAGCLGGTESFWEHPPSFDRSGLGSVTDRSLPERPDVIPVSLTADQRGRLRGRVESRLATIPEPLTAETLPNGRIRRAITDHRERARAALEEMASRSETVPTVETAAEATAHAGRAAATWAAVLVDREPSDVVLSDSAASGRVGRLEADVPGRASSPQAAVVVYGAIESWLYEATHDTLVDGGLESDENPVHIGRAAGHNERVWALTAGGGFVRDRYVSGLDDAGNVAGDIDAAVVALAEPTRERFVEFHPSDAEDVYDPPAPDVLVERDVRRDSPGMDLLGEKLDGLYEPYRLRPVAWPDERSHPAYRLRGTHRSYAVLDALEALVGRIEDGDDLFPADAATVADARTGAIAALEPLVASDRPLDRWAASRLVATLARGDRMLTGEPDTEAVAEAYGEYVWVRLVAERVPDATERVAEALDG